jgi:hypothetical protein
LIYEHWKIEMPELDTVTLDRLSSEFFRSGRQLSLSDSARPYKVDEFVQGFENLRRSMTRLLNGLTEEQINYSPDDNTYSLSEVVSHMIAAQGNTYNAFIDLSAKPLPHVDPVPRNPGGGAEKGLTGALLQERLKKATEDLIKVFRLLNEEQLEQQAKNPFFGMMSAKGYMLFQLAHDLDHLKQAQTVRRSAGFPSKRVTQA